VVLDTALESAPKVGQENFFWSKRIIVAWKIYNIHSGKIVKAGFDDEEIAKDWLENRRDLEQVDFLVEEMDDEEEEEYASREDDDEEVGASFQAEATDDDDDDDDDDSKEEAFDDDEESLDDDEESDDDEDDDD